MNVTREEKISEAIMKQSTITSILDEAQTVARKLREEGEWIPDLCERLAALAGMADEYREADGETFEAVLFKAAVVLGVEII